MALRLMQVFLPGGSRLDLQTLFEHHDLLGTWLDSRGEDRTMLYLLVPAEQTEPTMDRLEQTFGSQDGFHLVLLAPRRSCPVESRRHHPTRRRCRSHNLLRRPSAG